MPKIRTTLAWEAALKADDRRRVQALLDKGRPPADILATHAVQSEWALEALLAAGADPLAADPKGRNLLHAAAHRLQMPLVRRLLAEGIYAGVRCAKGKTPLHEAAGAARSRGHAALILEVLLHAHAPVDAQDHQGRTAAHEAARMGRTGSLMTLYQAGADFSLPNQAGHTAEALLKTHHHAEALHWLLARDRHRAHTHAAEETRTRRP